MAHMCLAVTFPLHLWHSDRGLLHATAVTRGWNGHQNRSEHKKLTLERKILLPLLLGLFDHTELQSKNNELQNTEPNRA